MKKHLIIGNPIDHSLSPKIHNYWFKKYNINGVYEKFAAKKDELSKIVKKIKNEELFGANITVPFKQSIIPFLDTLSSSAKKTYSVNTIFKKNEKICGDNTDIVGFELAIQNSNFDFKNKSAFIFGAGGVTPSIIFGLKNLGIDEIFLSNRTLQKVENIKSNFPFINKVKWGEIENCDIYKYFAVCLLGGRIALRASENAIHDLHMERKRANRTSKGAIGRIKVAGMAIFAFRW